MSRDLTATMQTALAEPTIRPVLIAYLDIASDPISMWTGAGTFAPTGSGDAILNGKTFYSAQSFVDVSDIVEDQGIGGPVSIVLKANDLDEDALRQIARDRDAWRGRPAYIWMGLLNSTLNAVHADPVRIKTGIMTQIIVARSFSEVAIKLTVDVDVSNARSAPFRLLDHQRIHPGDTFSSYVIELSNKSSGLERTSGSMNVAAYDQNEAWARDNQWNEYR
jgi:hypothetical protein